MKKWPRNGTDTAVILEVLQRFTLVQPCEMAAMTGLSRDRVYMALHGLRKRQLVSLRDEDGRYELGPAALDILNPPTSSQVESMPTYLPTPDRLIQLRETWGAHA